MGKEGNERKMKKEEKKREEKKGKEKSNIPVSLLSKIIVKINVTLIVPMM